MSPDSRPGDAGRKHHWENVLTQLKGFVRNCVSSLNRRFTEEPTNGSKNRTDISSSVGGCEWTVTRRRDLPMSRWESRPVSLVSRELRKRSHLVPCLLSEGQNMTTFCEQNNTQSEGAEISYKISDKTRRQRQGREWGVRLSVSCPLLSDKYILIPLLSYSELTGQNFVPFCWFCWSTSLCIKLTRLYWLNCLI